MVNSGSFDSDVDRNEKDCFTQYNHVVESPHSVISMHAVSVSLCENDFPTQTADSLPVSQAIEPTATKTEYKCNMSEEIVRVSDNLESKNSSDENKFMKDPYITTQSNTTQPFISGEPYVDRYINMGYLRKYKIETKPSICCSVPLDRIPNVLKTCSNIIANRTLTDFQNNKELVKKDMCLYCDRTFIIPTMKQKHMNRFHFSKFNKRVNLRRQTTKCLYCDLDSSECNLKQLFTHLTTKHPEKYFACLQCETRFPNLQLLETHKTTAHNVLLRLESNPIFNTPDTKTNEDKSDENEVVREPPSTIKTRIEYKRQTKINSTVETISQPTVETLTKAKRKCQSKYLNKSKLPPDSSQTTVKTRGDDAKAKIKSKFVKDLRNKKFSVISTKVGVKHALRITRQRSKVLENAKNTKKKSLPVNTTKNESNVTTKYLPYQNNSLSLFDISYRVKKITDHSIDNLRISSLTFDDVFDKAFFNRVKCNIQENLLNHVDGKLFKSIESENRISSFQKMKDTSVEECNSNNCGLSNTISNTTDVSIDSQFSEDSESQTEKSKKKSTPTEEPGNYKYFTRRKYQAVISERKGNKDLSKLDIWTQLVMKNRQQKIISDQKTDKEMIEYKKSDEYKVKMQREELNGILDKRGPLEDLKEEAMRTVALEKINSTSAETNIDTYFDVTIILNEILNNLFPKDSNITVSDKENCHLDDIRQSSPDKIPQGEEMLSMFNLQRISYSSRVNAIEDVLNNEIDKTATIELTGEWARTRIYICASCGIKLPNAKLLMDHKNLYHENVWCQHYEFVGNQGELYRHLSIPGLGKIGAIEDKIGNDAWRRSDARECSKCNKRFNNLGDLHRHMLECGGDLAWMLERKKYKYRPYGSKPRKKKRGLLRLLQAFRNNPKEKRKKTIKKFNGPRQKPSDADTIQRMLANLPAKRITRKAISLKDGFPRPILNKNIIKTKVIPTKNENKIITKKSVATANTNINRTRRILRSNSAILLDSKISLILPKFKRKKNENSKVIRRRSMRSNVQNLILKSNPVVATCKLTDDQIKSLVKTDSSIASGDRNGEEDDDSHLKEVEKSDTPPPPPPEQEPQIIQTEDEVLLPDDGPNVDTFNDSSKTVEATDSTKPTKVRKKKRRRKQISKSLQDNLQQNEVVPMKKVFKNKKPVKPVTTINTRKMHLRRINNAPAKVRTRPTRRSFARAKLTEIVQVDGSPHSKSVSKTKVSKSDLNDSLFTQSSVATTNTSSVEDSDNTTEAATVTENTESPIVNVKSLNQDDAVLEDCSKIKTDETLVKNNIVVEAAPVTVEQKLLIKIPPATKKSAKKTRGLNDCIAMLTNKLQDKHLDPSNNVLEAFSIKSLEKDALKVDDSLESKKEVPPVTPVEEIIDNSIVKPNGICLVPNGSHKEVKIITTEKDSTSEAKINFEESFEKVPEPERTNDDCKVPEKEIPKEVDELKVNKLKVKHKRKETRKRHLFKSVSKNILPVTTNDTLQEIPDKTNEPNMILNGTKNNSDFNNDLKDSDNSVNDLDKFSNSEKENSVNHTVIKIIKPRRTKKKMEKEILAEVPPLRNHLDDIINAVARNEIGDSEDELPLSELVKKYVSESKAADEEVSVLSVINESERISENPDNAVCVEEAKAKPTKKKRVSNPKPKRIYIRRKKRKEFEDPPITTQPEIAIDENIPETVVIEPQIKISIPLPLDNTPEAPSNDTLNEEITGQQPEESTINSLLNESESSETTFLDATVSSDSTFTVKSEVPVKKKRGRKPRALTTKLVERAEEEVSIAYCDICNKTFRRTENLLKHKRTLTHIAKLSELEVFQGKQQSQVDAVPVPTEEAVGEDTEPIENIDSVACVGFSPENNEVSSAFEDPIEPSQESLKLVDIIDDVLSKPVETEYIEHRNFSNLILQTDPEIKRCKSLGERKSFDCDKIPIIDTSNTSPIPIETNVSGTTADVIVEKQISLLENMIEDNRNTFKLPITEEYSCQSNSSAFSMLSSSKHEEFHEITFTHNTNIITNLIKPALEDNLMSTTQYEQISDDSNSSHLQIEEQKSRKALNRDEELFLECCSLLKSSSDASDLVRKNVRSTKFLNNFGLKPMNELEWLEQKQIPTISAILPRPIHNAIEVPQTNTSVRENFYNDLSYPGLGNSKLNICLEKNENDNFYSHPPIFEDISTESDGSSRKSVPLAKPSLNQFTDQTGFTIQLNQDDRSSPNVESAQIPFEEEKEVNVENSDEVDVVESSNQVDDVEGSDHVDVEISDPVDDESSNQVDVEHSDPVDVAIMEEEPASPSPIIKKPEGAKIVQTNITAYVVANKIKKHENKKLVTKGALKVFEGLKVSIPKDEIDMKEVLSCSPTSKRLEIEAEQDKLQEKKHTNKKETNHRNFLFNKIVKNGKKINNKLGLKITKKRYTIDSKLNKIHHEITKKTHDVYDFEETQDSVDIFIKNSDSLPDYHSFRNKITNKCEVDELDDDDDLKSKDDTKKGNKNNHCLPPNILCSRKLKMNKCITKKKCMIMGRIFKNALKSKISEEIKNIPVMDNKKIVEDFVLNCHDMQLNDQNNKPKLSEEEMNLLFDSLLNDNNMNNSLNKCKGETTVDADVTVKHTDKCKQRMNKCKKRHRGNSSDSSDEEFSIKRSAKKPINKKPNDNDCVINLEQELKECIGVASRKSQRKCTSGKQNVLMEYWSSDESNFDFERSVALQQNVTKELTSASVEVVSEVTEERPIAEEETKEVCDATKEIKAPVVKNRHTKKRRMIKPHKDLEPLNGEENDSETIASTRQKRNAVDTLYYWSSSSEDEIQDVVEVKSLREQCDDEEDRPLQQGWIVGDSPKKLVTMLAQAKGKKLDVEYVKKNRKKRTSV